jgi:hypothetical protein
MHTVLQKRRPVFALARQWAGFQTQLDALEAEVTRLERVIRRAIDDLQRLGADREAKRVERELRAR